MKAQLIKSKIMFTALLIFPLVFNSFSQKDTLKVILKEQNDLKNDLNLLMESFEEKRKDDSTYNADSKKADSIQMADLKEVLKKVADDVDTSLVIGEVYLKPLAKKGEVMKFCSDKKCAQPLRTKVTEDECKECSDDEYCDSSQPRKERHIYKKNEIQITITKVRFSFSDGYINSVRVYTADGYIFNNGMAPISLNRINKRSDVLECLDPTHHYVIYLSDIIEYDEGKRFLPSDADIELTLKDTSTMVTKSVGINSIVNLRLFTDALALLDQESNGLAQTELDFSIPIHRRNVANKYFYWFSDVNFKAQFSRLDNDFRYTAVDTSSNMLSRDILHQRRWFNAEIGLPSFKGRLAKRSESTYGLDLIAGLNASNIANNGDSSTFILPYFGFNPKLHLASSSNFGVDIALPFFYEIFPAKQTDSYGDGKWFFNPNLEVYYNTFGDRSSRIFGRIGYTTLTETRGDYFTLQIGYTISLSKKLNKLAK